MPGSLPGAFLFMIISGTLFALSLAMSFAIGDWIADRTKQHGAETFFAWVFLLGFWTVVIFLFARGIVTPEILFRPLWWLLGLLGWPT